MGALGHRAGDRAGESLSVSRWRDNDDGTIIDGIYSFFHPNYNKAMARGLYRLSFDDHILSQLPDLSAHEKLELRLSMPREFWPRKWLEEEKDAAK